MDTHSPDFAHPCFVCSAITCAAPVATPGYVFGVATSLQVPNFAVAVTCAAGYTANNPTISVCDEEGGAPTLSGCTGPLAVFWLGCGLPTNTEDIDLRMLYD